MLHKESYCSLLAASSAGPILRPLAGLTALNPLSLSICLGQPCPRNEGKACVVEATAVFTHNTYLSHRDPGPKAPNMWLLPWQGDSCLSSVTSSLILQERYRCFLLSLPRIVLNLKNVFFSYFINKNVMLDHPRRS